MPPMMPGQKGGPRHRHDAILTREKPRNTRRTLSKLMKYIGRNKYLFFALIAVMLIITALGLAAPKIQQIAIDCMTLTENRLSVDSDKLVKTLIVLASVYVLQAVLSYLQGIFAAKLSQYTVKTMRRDLFRSLVKLPIKYIDNHRHGDLMSRMTNDVENISNTVSQSIGSLV